MASGSVAKQLLGAPLFHSAVLRRFPAAEVLAAEKRSWDDEVFEMRKRIKEAEANSSTSAAQEFIYDDMLHGIEAAFENGQRAQHDASDRLASLNACLKARHTEAAAKAIGGASSTSSSSSE